MEPIVIKELDQKRFNALVTHTRLAYSEIFAQEIAWFSNSDETIIGVILLDKTDEDFTAIVLGRDEIDRYRAIDLSHSYQSYDEALIWLTGTIKWNTGLNKKIFPQNDKDHEQLDLFKPIVPIEKQHPYFVHLNTTRSFDSAKAIINEIMPHYIDVDGNYIEQFQSSGFDSRLWELYLFSFLNEQKFILDRKYNSPDFLAKKGFDSIAIEAVIVGRKSENPPKYINLFEKLKSKREIKEELQDSMPIKFGSPLYSKLKKKYWELPHVVGFPLIFAIADFHDDASMMWSSSALDTYLYGYRHDHKRDEKGNLIITTSKVEVHKIGNKEIPSGFFFQPETENISAVLFSSSGTLSKFNRMGKQAGYGSKDIKMLRRGAYHDHDPNASVPKLFQYYVTTNSQETWGEGVSLYHNPKAKFPINRDLFPSIAHHYFLEGQIKSYLPEFHPYTSMTLLFEPEI